MTEKGQEQHLAGKLALRGIWLCNMCWFPIMANFKLVTKWGDICCSVTKSYLTLCNPMDCSTPGFSVLHYLLELAQTHVHRVGDAIHPSHPLSSPSFAFNLSQHQGLFQGVGSSHQVAQVLELQFQHQSFQWIIREDFFWIDWFDLLSVQGTLKSLLQHHSSKASILQHLAFFRIQLWHPYTTTGKTIALTRQKFVGKFVSAFEYAI